MSTHEINRKFHDEDNQIYSSTTTTNDTEYNSKDEPSRESVVPKDHSETRQTPGSNVDKETKNTCSQFSSSLRSTIASGSSSEGRTAEMGLLLSRSTHNSRILSTKSKSQKNLFAIFSVLFGEDEERPKEMGTLILLITMFLLFMISLTGVFVMWFTEYYNNVLLSNLVLRNGSETAQSWMNPNRKYDTLLKVHIFNYTNIQSFLAGKDDRIHLKDIGPLTYQEHTSKVNVIFNDNYTVTFRDHRSYQFLPEKSSMDENDGIFVPNVPLFAADQMIDSMSGFARISATLALKTLQEPAFKRLTAHEYLWGYRDRISALQFAAGKSQFGLLKNRNGTSIDSLQINTGEDDLKKFSIITQFNGMPLLDFWTENECNRIDGSDGSMFPPHLAETRAPLSVFLQVLCRKVPLIYEKEVLLFNNVNALRYRAPLNVFSNPEGNSENTCYCKDTRRCMPSGVINATKCYGGVPIYPSFPHFFAGDPDLYRRHFDGIEPKEELHQTYADIHPRFGFPISGASRIQINIGVHKGTTIERQIRRLEKDLILPLIWIEITSGNFTDDVIDKLHASTYGLNLIQYTLKYGTLLMCLLFFAIILAGFYYLAKKRDELRSSQQNVCHLKTELKSLNKLQELKSNKSSASLK